MREEIYSLLPDAFATFGQPRALAEYLATRMRAVAEAFPGESAAQCWARVIWSDGMGDEDMLEALRQLVPGEKGECDE